MSLHSLGSELGVYVGTLVVCFVAGLIPLVNAELWLVAVVAVVKTPAPLPGVVVLAASGQMLAKMVLYYGTYGATNLPTGRRHEQVERARLKLASWRRRPLLVLWASATLGLPPFYVVTLLAGALGYRLRTFLAIGITGRLVRFAVLVTIAWQGFA